MTSLADDQVGALANRSSVRRSFRFGLSVRLNSNANHLVTLCCIVVVHLVDQRVHERRENNVGERIAV